MRTALPAFVLLAAALGLSSCYYPPPPPPPAYDYPPPAFGGPPPAPPPPMAEPFAYGEPVPPPPGLRRGCGPGRHWVRAHRERRSGRLIRAHCAPNRRR